MSPEVPTAAPASRPYGEHVPAFTEPRPRRGILILVATATLATALGGCAVPHSLDSTPPSGVPTPSATDTVGEYGQDDLVVRDGTTELRLAALALDESGDTAGIAPQASVSGDALYVFIRPAGWTLQADQFSGTSQYDCASWHTETTVDDLGGGWWRVEPGGPAGEYQVVLTGSSGPGLPLGGTVGESSALLDWTTSTSNDSPTPTGQAAFGGDSGRNLTIAFNGAPLGWTSAASTVTVTGASGVALDLEPALDPPNCVGSDSVFFSRDLTADQFSSLGGAPYRFEVGVTVDGTRYRASGRSDDEGEADLSYRR